MSDDIITPLASSDPESCNVKKYFASGEKIHEFFARNEEARASYCCFKTNTCRRVLMDARKSCCVFPIGACGFPLWIISLAMCLPFELLGCPCDDSLIKKPPDVASDLDSKPVASINSDGVVVDTFYEVNDEYDRITSLIPWNSIASISVRKPRKTLRPCGSINFFNCSKHESWKYKSNHCYSTYFPYLKYGGISFPCDIGCGVCGPCCTVIITEKVIEDYSEVIFYYSKEVQQNSAQLIVPEIYIQSCRDQCDQRGMELIVGTDIVKIKLMGLLQVDQFIADIQRDGKHYRNGVTVPVHENRPHKVINPGFENDGYNGGDSGPTGSLNPDYNGFEEEWDFSPHSHGGL